MLEELYNTLEKANKSLVKLIESSTDSMNVMIRKGQILLWQGDKVDYIKVIKSGAAKVYSILSDGNVYTYSILGEGSIIGLPQFFLDELSKVTIETMENTNVILVSSSAFRRLLTSNPQLSFIIMKKLASALESLRTTQSDLAPLLNVQERLKRGLAKLAKDCGIKKDNGTYIKLNITHKEIGELIGANRTTITHFINELIRQGYLCKDGKYFVIKNLKNYNYT